MRVLAIESSGITASVAVLDASGPLTEQVLEPSERSARGLAPAIARALADVGWRATDVELVAVTSGPGSFTGLRVGVTTAKALAYASGSSILGLNTLEVIAAGMPNNFEQFSVVIDAQRKQSFLAKFARGEDGFIRFTQETTIVDDQQWLADLAPGQLVTGPGLEKLQAQLPEGVVAADRQHWAPQAVAVGQLASRLFAAGQRDDVFTLVPNYFRRTAAEEQWERKPPPKR